MSEWTQRSFLVWGLGLTLWLAGCAQFETDPDPDSSGTGTGKPSRETLARLQERNRDRLFLDLDKNLKTWRSLSAKRETQQSLASFLSQYVLANRGAILAALESEAPRERAIAAGALYFLDDPVVVAPLVSVLDDEEPSVVANALLALGVIADLTVPVQEVAVLARRSDLFIRQNAVVVLGRLAALNPSDEAVSALVVGLTDEEPAVRFNAVKGLALRGYSGIAEPVSALLHDPWPRVRAHAALTLAAIGDSTVIESLRPLLGDNSELVQAATLSAIETLEWQPTP